MDLETYLGDRSGAHDHQPLLIGRYKADRGFSCNDTGFQLVHTGVGAVVYLIQQDFHGFLTDLIQRLGQSGEFGADLFRQKGIIKAGNGDVLWNRIAQFTESGDGFTGGDVIVGQVSFTVQA